MTKTLSPARGLQAPPTAPATRHGHATPAAPRWFNIGEAARQARLSARMVRHYETLGLLPSVGRTESGYRQYSERDVHTLRFIQRARSLGFGMGEIAELLALWHDQKRSSASVKRIAQAHVDNLSERIAELTAMQRTLQHLVHCCHGDHRPDCPILEELGQERGMARSAEAAPQSQA